ncbi:sugar ABC transporter substrate-binding protein [Sphingorhabdus sp.]|uniref:sugar ABC transporter substrate-binding protein n=1 Tax=Sphingorhabdus sp. TaxID=1902408 RepID=UPI0032B721B5
MALIRKHPWISAAIVVLALVVLANVFISRSTTDKKQIYVFLPSVENPFWLDVREGVEREAKTLGPEYDVRIVTTASTDGSDQIDQMSTAIARGQVDGVVLAPTNDRAPAPLVAQLNRNETPVVLIDTDLNAEAKKQVNAQWDAFIGSDNRLGGQMAAKTIIDSLAAASGPKSVLLLKGSYVHQSAIDRAEGFIGAAKPVLRIVERSGEWSKQTANEITASQFSREPLSAIFASNDEMALGAVAALRKLNVPQGRWPIIIGFDATADAQTAIRDGYMFASIRQQAEEMGANGLRKLIALIEGRASSDPKTKTLVKVDVVTKSNLPKSR